jgi:hypothetical protein
MNRLAVAGGTALGTALIMAMWAVLSSGALGAERLATVGPTPSVVAWLTFGLIAIGGALIALLAAPRAPEPPPVSIVPDPANHPDHEPEESAKEQHA